QVGAFGNDVQASKQGDALVFQQLHDVALALGADEFQSQQAADGLFGGDHLRARQLRRGDDLGQAEGTDQGYKKEQPANLGSEAARCQAEQADIGAGADFGPNPRRPFVVATTRQAGEALVAKHRGKGVDAAAVTGLGQLALDVIDGQVAFAHGEDQVAD